MGLLYTNKKQKMNILRPTSQKLFNKKIYGFDIETKNNNKSFVLASIYSDDFQKFYYTKKDLIHDIKTDPKFRNAYIFATNLSFDFFGTFFRQDESKYFYTLFRGSDLLMAKTHFYKQKFHKDPKVKTRTLKSLTFLDSLNYAHLSVAQMGKIIGIPKLEKPSCLGQSIKSNEDLDELKKYNLTDSKITYLFMKFLINSFEDLGATFKLTLASTSMSLFKNKYLNDTYFQPPKNLLLEQFESYYGGRTEALCRGEFKNKQYYDFNSLYPSVMMNEFPDPNSLRVTYKNNLNQINKYHGCSKVKIHVPYVKYPVLPHRKENGRVIFPYGTFYGTYTHIELREAIKQGAIILKVFKTQYFKKTCYPFKDFITDLYNLRLKYKKDKNIMEYVVKITMNSLYGKFGQKFINRDNWIHEEQFNISDIKNGMHVEHKNGYVRVITPDSRPSSFCTPIWASYVAAYGRLKLHKAIVQYNPIYCDTDSLITDSTIPTSNKLGDLKLEMNISKGIVVRPKFYALLDKDNKEYVKIKGLGKRLTFIQFSGLLKNPYIEYEKFTKFKESLRRELIPNEIIKTHKEFSLNDEKRVWFSDFSLTFEESKPIKI